MLSGDDGLTLPLMVLGARGVISVTANVVPHRVRDLVDHALNGRWEEARQIHRELYPLNKTLFIETNPIPVKTALAMMKKIKLEFRLPLCEMNPENRKKLTEALRKNGVRV